MEKNQGPQLNLDLKSTTKVESEDGNVLFGQGVILREVSRFLSGNGEQGIIPIPCFYDIKSGKIITKLLPPDIRSEYEEEEIKQ